MSRLFRTPQAMLVEIEKMKNAERDRRADRATVSEFFNGAPPLTDKEAEDLGFTINVNSLYGYSDLNNAKNHLFSLYTKPSRHIEIELDAAPPNKRIEWGMIATEAANRVLRKSLSFKTTYEGVCGDAALHGLGVPFFGNRTHPIASQAALSQLLVPDDTPADVTKLTHFALEAPMELDMLHYYASRDLPGWKTGNLKKVLAEIYDDELKDGAILDSDNLEELELARQQNGNSSVKGRPQALVYYFYQRRSDIDGLPWDLTILRRESPKDREKAQGSVLYDEDYCYCNVHEVIHPFFMDCIIGGVPKWHRVLGLGHLNYQLNHTIELMRNRLNQAVHEGAMNLWKANNSVSREEVQQIVLKHNGVVPEGFELLQNRFAPNFSGLLEAIQMSRQQASRNAFTSTPNSGDRNDVLEVQALAEQGSAENQLTNRTSNFYDYWDAFLSEQVRRLTSHELVADSPGYSMVMDFQGECLRRGFDNLHWLQPHNVRVRAVRIVGNGIRRDEIAIASYLTQNRQQYAPEMQQRITRISTALVTGNHRLAEDLTPMQEEQDTPQTQRVEGENAIIMTQRKPLKPNADDVDEVHVAGHFPAMQQMIQDAVQYQRSAFIPQQAEAFQVLGAHIKMHIDRIEGKAINQRNDPDRQKARAFMDALNELASMGDKLAHNMQQMQGQEGEDDVEKLKLQLAAAEQARKEKKDAFAEQKFIRTQSAREQQAAFQQVHSLEERQRKEKEFARDTAAEDTRLAMEVAGAGTSSDA